MKQIFSSSVISHMKECILALFWRKIDIYNFFKDSGCSVRYLPMRNNLEDMNRNSIIEYVFNSLSLSPDKGKVQIYSFLEVLSNWDYFNPYYFDDLKKLDRNKAQILITKLKDIHNEYKRSIIKSKTVFNNIEKEQEISLEDLSNEYMGLFKRVDKDGNNISNQKRGYHFEKLIGKLAKREKLAITESFKIKGEQIDGAIKYEGEHYLIEGKWNDAASASNDLYHFAYKIEGKMYGRGLFLSVNGFSIEAVESLVKGKAIKTILIDGTDLMYVIEGRISFSELLDNKIKAAQTAGLIYYDVIIQKSKI